MGKGVHSRSPSRLRGFGRRQRLRLARPADPENQLPIAPDEHGIEAVADALGCDRRLVAAWWSDFVRQRLAPPGSTTGPQSAAAVPVTAQETGNHRPGRLTGPGGPSGAGGLAGRAQTGRERRRPDGHGTTARRGQADGAGERLDLVLDAGSFVELDLFARHTASGFGLDDRRPATDGVVTGWGTVHGRQVFVFAQDFRIFGGALGETYARRSTRSWTTTGTEDASRREEHRDVLLSMTLWIFLA